MATRGTQPQASVWLAAPVQPAARKAAPGLDRDRIVAAAMRLLDAEGLAGFSMRRLAAELGVSAMSVYWYVANKDDLLELALDTACGRLDLPRLEDENDWRDDLRQIATEFRGLLVAHPWTSRLMGEYLNIGPNSVTLSAVAQQVMVRTGLPRELVPGALSTVFQFVYGFATEEGRWGQRCREAGMTQDELFRSIMESMEGREEYAGQQELMHRRMSGSLEEARERDFGFALDCVIAGIEVMSGRRSKG